MNKIDEIKITPETAREALYRLDGPIASEEGMIIENALTAWEEEREELERMKKAKAVTDASWRELMEEIRKLREENGTQRLLIDVLKLAREERDKLIEGLRDIAAVVYVFKYKLPSEYARDILREIGVTVE